MFIPKMIAQDSSKSITTNDGIYDFTTFSQHEDNVVMQVLTSFVDSYPPQFRGIGLYSEADSIVYKPRYILMQSVICLFSKSENPLSLLAVCLAYASKGASFRTNAIEYWEKAYPNLDEQQMCQFPATLPLTVYSTIYKLYEDEHDYENAMKYFRLLGQLVTPGNAWYENRKKVLLAKIKDPPIYRQRKMKQREFDLEKKILQATVYYLGKANLLK